MTGHQIESFVGDLVAMAQATKRLPEVEADLRDATIQMNGQAEAIQRLELKLMDAKNLEDTLRASIRDLEVARDDAELRFLEAEDQTAKVRSLVASLALVIQPPTAPQPMEVPQSNVDPTPNASTSLNSADPSHALGSERASPPTSALSAPIGTGTETVASSYETAPAYPDEHTRGQSEVDPTTAPTPNSIDSPLEAFSASTAESTLTNLASPPYLNKRYSEVPGFVSYSDWIDGGGTAENRNL